MQNDAKPMPHLIREKNCCQMTKKLAFLPNS